MKVVWFSLMILGFVVLTHYRAQMNAALNVRKDNHPIETWEDLLESNYNLLVWRDSAIEDIFKHASDGSTLKSIFNEKIKESPDLNSISFAESIPYLLNDSSVIYNEFETFKLLARQQYPCQLSFLSQLRGSTYITMPFAKNSPFLAPVNDVLRHMLQSGMMKRIWMKYEPLLREDECEEPRQVLGYPQLIFPFLVLLFGIVTSILGCIHEFLIKRQK